MELFRVVLGYATYEVSNCGNVRNKLTGRILKPGNSQGYMLVNLSNSKGERKSLKVHRLVAIAFINNPNNKLIVDHINNNRSDNRVTNLRWATNSENGINSSKRIDSKKYKGVGYCDIIEVGVLEYIRVLIT